MSNVMRYTYIAPVEHDDLGGPWEDLMASSGQSMWRCLISTSSRLPYFCMRNMPPVPQSHCCHAGSGETRELMVGFLSFFSCDARDVAGSPVGGT